MAWKDINNILCTTDFSDLSLDALEYGVKLAQDCKAKVHLIHILPNFPFSQMPFEYQDNSLTIEELTQKNADDELKKIAEKHIPDSVDSEYHVKKEDSSYQGIINYAKDNNIDLIIITTHGFGGFKHAIFGSTTERVVRLAHCPVLSLKSDAK